MILISVVDKSGSGVFVFIVCVGVGIGIGIDSGLRVEMYKNERKIESKSNSESESKIRHLSCYHPLIYFSTIEIYSNYLEELRYMYEITSEVSFSAAHRLLNYKGPCENLHGHNWLVRASVRCTKLDISGIGIDFKVLKKKLNEIVNEFDHRDLNAVLELVKLNPSSENIAHYIFDRLKIALSDWDGSVSRVEVYETPGNCAAYFE